MAAIEGLVAVVTGGASGIGASCAEAFAAAGARVAVVDLDPGHGSHLRIQADVMSGEQVQAAMETVVVMYGGIDILVNCAGIAAVGDVDANGDEEWARVLDVNVTGVMRSCRAALPYLRLSSHPAIVNMSSIAATAGLAHRVLYSASKGAVHALTLAMATDLVTEGIRVNCVAPGTVDTAWVTRLLSTVDDPAAERARLVARQPTGRLVRPEEVAAAVVYLAGPSAASVTGVSLPVDGGMSGLRTMRP